MKVVRTHFRGRHFIRMALVALLAVPAMTLAGCGKSYTYKYRITVSVRDHGELKSASNVVSVEESIGWDSNSGYAVLCGEATAVPLRDGKYLFALLQGPQKSASTRGFRWRSAPTGVLLNRLSLETDWPKNDKGILGLKSSRNAIDLQYSEMPDLVTFKNIQDPASIATVDPEHPEAILGEGVRIEKIALQLTDERVTRGRVQSILSWLNTGNNFLDGSKLGERVHSYESRNFMRCNRFTE